MLLPSQLRATGPELLPGTTAGGPRWVEVVGGDGEECEQVCVWGGEGKSNGCGGAYGRGKGVTFRCED